MLAFASEYGPGHASAGTSPVASWRPIWRAGVNPASGWWYNNDSIQASHLRAML